MQLIARWVALLVRISVPVPTSEQEPAWALSAKPTVLLGFAGFCVALTIPSLVAILALPGKRAGAPMAKHLIHQAFADHNNPSPTTRLPGFSQPLFLTRGVVLLAGDALM